MEQTKVTLGYWAARGAGQSVRNLLTYLAVPFEDKQYADPNTWFQQDKPALKTDFPNLPYLIDGEKVVTETEAIAIYMVLKAKRSDLLGNTSEDKILLAQIRGVINDARNTLFEITFNKACPDVVKAFQEKVLPKLALISKHLGNKEFLLGKLSVLDFFFSELVAWIRLQDGDWLATVPNLKEYVTRVFSLPGLKEYFAADKQPKFFMNPAYVHEKIKV